VVDFKNTKQFKNCEKNKDTFDFKTYFEYCVSKNKNNQKLLLHYEKPIFRKLKFNEFINTQKSESKMLKNFSKKFGNDKNTIFVMGDHDIICDDGEEKDYEPLICKKIRKIFKTANYKTYLINEYKTSKICNICNENLVPFLKTSSINLNKPNHYGLLRCQSVKHKCEIIHNRDKNSVLNMLNIVKCYINTSKKPSVFMRNL
jgi:hypothetical protein